MYWNLWFSIRCLSNDYLDMPALFKGLMARGLGTIVFPIRGYWLGIGHLDDFERAHGEYLEVFG